MKFIAFELLGKDAEKFLQGQLTNNVAKITSDFLPSAICNLKGRVQFGLWIRRIDENFCLVMADDLADDFKAHIKKYGAFSKITLSEPTPIYPAVLNATPTFSPSSDDENWTDWQTISLATGNYWITKQTSELFQPQELRLHQRGGVDYDKGCYLGQEIIARLWFKASPKAWLHRVQLDEFDDKIQVVNANDNQALIIARPDDMTQLTVLDFPEALQQPISRT